MFKKLVYAATFALAGASAYAAPITPTFTSFGDIDAAFSNTVTFGGSGIPTAPGSITEIGISGTDTILRMGIMATPRFSSPAPVDDGAGTYTVEPGESIGGSPGASKWNFSFAAELVGPDSFTISDVNLQLLYDLDPGTNTDDSLMGVIDFGSVPGAGGLSFIEGSQNASFGFLTSALVPGVTPPAFTPFSIFAPGEYSFALRASVNNEISEASINVTVAPVPLPAGGALLLTALAGAAALKRRKTV
ncbi:hypothetical protein So717_40620 [Roseobacter cerasinus]|uniref:VPLPA-CTERM protein sorting domain-containing protein n=2 Tax=Roseobacter cerasinus TaxID=2602289 RepID=A0A640VWA0_9RHOB|nr:hypothetical protein So717_40620 [Roseobacter cerasinus]